MIQPLFSDDNRIRFATVDEKYHIADILNLKKFRVSDTEISYRLINYLDEDGLLGDNREGKGWRSFSLKEIIYLYLILELKSYGFTQDSLQEICSALLTNQVSKKPGKTFFDIAIGLCLAQVEVKIIAQQSGEIVFFDPAYYTLVQTGLMFSSIEKSSYLHIRLNDLVNKGLLLVKRKPLDIKDSAAERYFTQLAKPEKPELTDKEQKVLNALRNKDYLSVEVRKKGGELCTMKVEQLEEYLNELSEITNLIKQKDYADIRLVKRDGKVVHLESKDTIKL
jgi:DNA-binding transcriptional MerR regulator